jgi:hypothetical protein
LLGVDQLALPRDIIHYWRGARVIERSDETKN